MSALRQALADYLAVRRALGYKLKRDEKLLAQFLTYHEEQGDGHLRTATMLAWAKLPIDPHRSWASARLSIVRAFASYLRTIDPATEVPSSDLLPWRRCRATPFLYSDDDVAAVMEAAGELHTPHRAATYRTLIGLLAVTGIRVGESIRLDLRDFDDRHGVLTVRNSKFGKSRELPLHPSTVDALVRYLRRPDRPCKAAKPAPVFVSRVGTQLHYSEVVRTFHKLVRRAGITARSASCRPRLHDFRHSFAVRILLDWYRNGIDTPTRLPLLSTYLGHVDPGATYWYLSAAPELLQLVGDRLERHLGGVR
jgi:integrase